MVFVSFSLRLCLLQGQVASVDIKLPRRSLQVEFSCNSCGVRTKRLINRLAYERGLVFVQVKSYVCLIVLRELIKSFCSSCGSVEDVLSIISWLTILVSLLSMTSAKKPPRIQLLIKFDLFFFCFLSSS